MTTLNTLEMGMTTASVNLQESTMSLSCWYINVIDQYSFKWKESILNLEDYRKTFQCYKTLLGAEWLRGHEVQGGWTLQLWSQIKVRPQLWKNVSHTKLQHLTAADIVLYRHIIPQFTGTKAFMHEMLIVTSCHKNRKVYLQKYLKQILRET